MNNTHTFLPVKKKSFYIKGYLKFYYGNSVKHSWLIATCGLDLCNYYNFFLKKDFCFNRLSAPFNFAHVSLASSKECKFNKSKIKGLNKANFTIPIYHTNVIRSDGRSFWLEVLNQNDLSNITDFFVEDRFKEKPFKFHLTILNKKNG